MGEPTDLYERLYFHEIEAREQLNSRLQLPLSLIVVLGGVFAYLLQSADPDASSHVSLVFQVTLSSMGIALVCSAYLFSRAAWWYDYKLVPYANQTANSWKDLKEYDAKHGTTIADRTMAEYLKGHFIEGATANARNNDLRSAYLHWSNMAVVATSAFALLSFLSFVLGDLGRKQGPTQVSILQPVEVRGIPDRVVVVPAEASTATVQHAADLDIPSTQPRKQNDATGPTAATSAAATTTDAPSPGGRSPSAAASETKR